MHAVCEPRSPSGSVSAACAQLRCLTQAQELRDLRAGLDHRLAWTREICAKVRPVHRSLVVPLLQSVRCLLLRLDLEPRRLCPAGAQPGHYTRPLPGGEPVQPGCVRAGAAGPRPHLGALCTALRLPLTPRSCVPLQLLVQAMNTPGLGCLR